MENELKRERFEGPDILRGIAATGIIFFHLIALSGLNFNNKVIMIINKFGSFVPLFFAISAFSIAYNYSENIFSKERMHDFFIKRFFRLAPLFYTVFLIEAVIVYFIYNKHVHSLFDTILTITFTFPFIPGKHESLVWGGWSIGVEWLFYITFPLTIILLKNKTTTTIAWFVFIYLSINMDKNIHISGLDSYSYMNFLNHLIFFIVGIGVFHCLKIIYKLKDKIKYKGQTFLTIIFVSTMLLYTLYYYLGLYTYFHPFIMLSFILFILLTLSIVGLPCILVNRFTKFLGKASYSIYLNHPPIIIVLKSIGFYNFIYKNINSSILVFLVSVVVTVFIVFMISNLTYKFIEVPGINLGKKIIKGRFLDLKELLNNKRSNRRRRPLNF